MKRISAWIVASGIFLLGSIATAQMPYYPPAGMPYYPPPYGYPGYPPAMPYGAPPSPYGGYNPFPYVPSGMPGGNANPGGMPLPYPPTGAPQQRFPPGMLPPVPPPSGMLYGNSNPGGLPQPFSPDGGPQGGTPKPIVPGTLPFSYPNPPAPPPGISGVLPFAPFPMSPGANPGLQLFQPIPRPGGIFPPPPGPTQPFPPPPTPLPKNGPPAKGGINPPPGEPYLFPQEKPPLLPDSRYDAPKQLPVVVEPEMTHDALVSPVGYSAPAYLPPAEPYVLYEGPRSEAELKEEVTHVWAQASYIHWWIRRDVTPPLLASGSLANPGTTVLFGGGSVAPNEFSGVQANIGAWLDDEHYCGIEAAGFWLGKNRRNYSFGSDAGNPPLALPVIIGGAEHAINLSSPASASGLSGGMNAVSTVDLGGAELNFVNNLLRVHGWSIDVLGGFRYLYLNDSLVMNDTFTTLPGNPAGLFFNQALVTDSFNINNRFYGGQIGARIGWTWCGFDIGVTGKIAVGATVHTATINGSTTVSAGGTSMTDAGGIYALASNIGQYHTTDTSVVPELALNVGYQITPRIRILAGYTALSWSNVYRAGDQIDRNVAVGQVPAVAAALGIPTTPGTAPIFPATRSAFWAQGVNVGLEVRY